MFSALSRVGDSCPWWRPLSHGPVNLEALHLEFWVDNLCWRYLGPLERSIEDFCVSNHRHQCFCGREWLGCVRQWFGSCVRNTKASTASLGFHVKEAVVGRQAWGSVESFAQPQGRSLPAAGLHSARWLQGGWILLFQEKQVTVCFVHCFVVVCLFVWLLLFFK